MPQVPFNDDSLCACRSHESLAVYDTPASPIPITPNGDCDCFQCSTARSNVTGRLMPRLLNALNEHPERVKFPKGDSR